VFDPQDMNGKGVIGRLRMEGMTSYEVGPGEKPSVAVFCGEKKGAPASVKIYSLASLIPTPAEPPKPVSQKQFFKADKIQMKWNTAGTGLLFITSTDIDKSNKSYYGESNLYMMSTRGDFDCRVALDKEGPVHDFAWNPNGREFVVVYGFMPAKITLFSYRINVIAELGVSSRNFISFSPQGRFIALAGFGNLSGVVDVWDREKLGNNGSSVEANVVGKLFSFDASNSSVFEWSPDGQFILTATLSPRLRVDNGVKVYHCTGNLIHVEMINDLYQASWRPMLPEVALEKYPFPSTIPTPPAPSAAAQTVIEANKVKAEKKAMGAYRPPGARGAPVSDAFSKRYEETMSAGPSDGSAYVPPGAARNKLQGGGRKNVPGSAPAGPKNGPTQQTNSKGKKNNGQQQHQQHSGASTPTGPRTNFAEDVQSAGGASTPTNMAAEIGGSTLEGDEGNATGNGNGASIAPGAIDKKVRNLTKKLKAIQELKEKREKGEKLEQTQVKKIESEAALMKELAALE
jgi:translation initiation factor 2A